MSYAFLEYMISSMEFNSDQDCRDWIEQFLIIESSNGVRTWQPRPDWQSNLLQWIGQNLPHIIKTDTELGAELSHRLYQLAQDNASRLLNRLYDLAPALDD